MKKVLFVLLATLCVVTSVSAQVARGKISFNVLDAYSSKGMMGVVVEVASKTNPNSKKYYTSGAAGAVSFTAAYGDYTINLSFIGYDDLVKEISITKPEESLGKLFITETTTKIETIVKEVKQFRTSQNADTLAYNAAAFKVTTDADVEGLLKKMPGITITNGSVEAQGETIKKIFVDGKEFFGDDVNTAIKSLPAEAVDRVEVFNKLSDQAEFSGMDDGEGYKAINIVTKVSMRQGQFGKIYAGLGYQPKADDSTFNPKYTVGGNVNFFQGDSRVSLLGLFNNINQQNFSFEDILGVSGGQGGFGGGRRGGGANDLMVRPQSGVALVNSLGLNYSDQWGRRDNVKFQGSYFFNTTNTKNHSVLNKWYEAPSPYGTQFEEGFSNTTNNNHRLNARLDWKISRIQSLMSRTALSYQGNNPQTEKLGFTNGDTDLIDPLLDVPHQGLSYLENYSKNKSRGLYFSQFLQYRIKLGKPGRTLSVDGSFNVYSASSKRRLRSNNADAVPYDDPNYDEMYNAYFVNGYWQDMRDNDLLYSPLAQYINTPSRSYTFRGSLQYQEPLGTYTSFAFQYRFSYNDQQRDQQAFYTDQEFENPTVNPNMTLNNNSGYWTHRVGPGFRYSKDKNRIIANVYYQRSSLVGDLVGIDRGDKINRTFNDFTYFGMVNVAFNSENSIRMFFRSNTNAPSITQLQSIFDVSNPQYMSIGNRDLKPSFNHSINFHYINSNMSKGRTFMWMFSMNHQSNYISQSTLYNSEGIQLPDTMGDIKIPTRQDGSHYRPTEITAYENMNGYWTLRTHISLGLPLSFMKCNLNLMAGVNYSITPSAVYLPGATSQTLLDNIINHRFETNYANNIGYDASVTLGSNISENLDFTLSWNGTYNQAWNKVSKNLDMRSVKNNYFTHTASGNLKWVFGRGFTFTTAMTFTQYIGFTNSYNEKFFLWNIYLGKKVFKNRRGEVQIGVNDVLNQNKAFVRSTGSGYTQNLTNSVIGRYFSVQFVYNLRHFGKRGSKQASDYDYTESKGSVGMGNANTGNRMWGPR